MIHKTVLVLLLLVALSCCTSNTLDDYREEAEGINRSLLKELQGVHTREDLVSRSPKVKKLFNKLVDVMIAAHEAKSKTPSETPPLSPEEKDLNDRLHAEISRIYTIDGARDLLEKMQQDPLYRLDAYLQKGFPASKAS